MIKWVLIGVSLFSLIACQSTSTEAATKQTLSNETASLNSTKKKDLPSNIQGVELVKHNIESNMEVKVLRVEPSTIENIYAVFLESGDVVYSSQDGMHFVAGDLYAVRTDVKGITNLTESYREADRAKVLSNIKKVDTIAFESKGKKKAHVYIFTDVDCYYCQKLHQEVPALNAAGIEVRYLGFPRAGLQSASFQKIQSAWCAKDMQSALNDLKARKPIPTNICNKKAVAEQFLLGRKIGVRGTPAIMTPSGKLISGYMPAKQLIASLGIN